MPTTREYARKCPGAADAYDIHGQQASNLRASTTENQRHSGQNTTTRERTAGITTLPHFSSVSLSYMGGFHLPPPPLPGHSISCFPASPYLYKKKYSETSAKQHTHAYILERCRCRAHHHHHHKLINTHILVPFSSQGRDPFRRVPTHSTQPAKKASHSPANSSTNSSVLLHKYVQTRPMHIMQASARVSGGGGGSRWA